MNERITLLALKASDPKTGWLDRQKFAELIVRECLVQIGNAIPDTDCSSSGPYKTARIAATSRVKEHFGVEE
jgi:hypothetical protein